MTLSTINVEDAGGTTRTFQVAQSTGGTFAACSVPVDVSLNPIDPAAAFTLAKSLNNFALVYGAFTDITAITSTGAQVIKLYSLVVNSANANTVTFKGSDGQVILQFYLIAGGSVVIPFSGELIGLTNPGASLHITCSGSGTVNGRFGYTQA